MANPAALPSPDTQFKVVSEAAQNFVEAYYDALNRRHRLESYYSSASPLLTAASVVPDISINGAVVASASEYEHLLNAQGGPVHYDVGSFDAHPANPNFVVGCPEALLPPITSPSAGGGGGGGGGERRNGKSVRDGDRISFVVQVNGTVKYGKAADVAVPNAFSTAAATSSTSTGGGGIGGAPGIAVNGVAGEETTTTTTTGPTGRIEKAFNESWLLVPHWEALHRNAPRNIRKWVVVSQNFRAL